MLGASISLSFVTVSTGLLVICTFGDGARCRFHFLDKSVKDEVERARFSRRVRALPLQARTD